MSAGKPFLTAFSSGVVFVVVVSYMLPVGLCRRSAAWAENASTPPRKLHVAASFYPLYYFARIVADERAEVRNITPAGAEPHDYEPTARDVARLEKSDLLILNGGLEAWGDKIEAGLREKRVTIVIAGEGLLTRRVAEKGKTAQDPHVWLSPPLAKREVERIVDGFKKVDPNHSSLYEERARGLEAQLDQLDRAYKVRLARCRLRDIVTSHAAFAYLAEAYGLRQIAVAGLSPDAEPSPRKVAEIAKFAKAEGLKYIFFERLVSPRLSETLASEIGAKTLVLDPIEGLSDEEIRRGKTYFTVMEENLTNLERALECAT